MCDGHKYFISCEKRERMVLFQLDWVFDTLGISDVMFIRSLSLLVIIKKLFFRE